MTAGSEDDAMKLMTERLLLRPVAEEDFDVAAAFFRDPVQGAPDGGPRPGSEDAAVRAAFVIAESAAIWKRVDYGPLAIELNGAFVGFCGLRPDPDAADADTAPPLLFYAVARAFWRFGVAYEAASACRIWAFEHLGFDRLNAVVRPDNAASLGLLRKLDFVETGPRKAFGADMLGFSACAETPAIRHSAA